MYISCSVLDVRIVDYLRSVLPLLAAELAVLLLLTCVPVLVTFLPDLLMGPAG
jgi:TRAP-type C4-dicarboxylate transport system permease large subunit